MQTIKTYEEYNQRRFGAPWVAKVDPKTGKPDFSIRVGGYTGDARRGESGDLYVIDPHDGDVYMYGQRDYRGNGTSRNYAVYLGGEYKQVTPTQLIQVLQGDYACLEAQ